MTFNPQVAGPTQDSVRATGPGSCPCAQLPAFLPRVRLAGCLRFTRAARSAGTNAPKKNDRAADDRS